MALRALKLLLVAAGPGPSLAAAGVTATGCPNKLPDSEEFRSSEFNRIHGRWPPPLRYPGALESKDSEEWLKYLEKKEAEINSFEGKWRWEYWLEHAQVTLLKTFTKTGWGIGTVPEELHKKVLTHFETQHSQKKAHDEGFVPGYIEGSRSIVHLPPDMHKEVTFAVKQGVAKWAGVSPDYLVPTSTYGIRTYYKNSTLKTHVDRVDTHVLSAIYVVDRSPVKEGQEPWWVVADPDLTGKRVSKDVPPGKLFFYESAKMNHGRPSVLEGDYSAHIFVHFKPKDWSFVNMDRVYGLPPHWNDPVEPPKQEL